MTEATFTKTFSTCTQCPHHKVLPDPDPLDWFCDDDVKVVCTLADLIVTTSCRPYKIVEETSIPSWCPLVESKPRVKQPA